MCIEEMEYIEAQRRWQKVCAKLENPHCNWGIERTLVPANGMAMLDEAYQRRIAKYKFIGDRLTGICQLYKQQVRSESRTQDLTPVEGDTTQTPSLHWSDLAEVMVVSQETPLEKLPNIVTEQTGAHHNKKNVQSPAVRRELSHSHPRPSPNATSREQQQPLQVVRQFFENVPMTTEEQQVPSEEAVLSVQLQENSHTNDGASAIEGTTGNRENSKPLEVTSLVPTINRRESQLSPPQVQEEEPRT